MKKLMRRLMSVVAAVVMALTMGVTAFAADGEVGGTGTITVKNATYGKDYVAYKIFDASYDTTDTTKVSYKVDETHKQYVSTTLFNVSSVKDSNGYYSVSKKEGTPDQDIIDWVKENYTNFDSTGTKGTFNANNDEVTFNVAYGYYYITSTLGTVITVDTAHPNAEVKDKNASAPTTPVKKIVSVDETTVPDTEEANAHVGSKIGFKITGNATNYTTNGEGTNVTYEANTQYQFTDTYTNLDVDLTKEIVVKVNGTETTKYTATDNNGKITFTIPLVDETGKHLYQATADKSAYIPVEITYYATVTSGAADSPATNNAGNNHDKVYTYKFQLNKVDQDEKALLGAKFSLYKGSETSPLKFILNDDGSYTYDPNGTVTEFDLTTVATKVIKGLDNRWTYTLKETKVPDGYNQAADTTINGSDLTKADGENTTTIHPVTIKNEKGGTLPSTGGMGTTIFYVLGAALVIGAGVVLVTRRRLSR